MESLSRDEVADVLETIAPDLERVEAILLEASTAGTPFLTESASYLTKAGGKRLRPALVALSSRLWSDPPDEAPVEAPDSRKAPLKAPGNPSEAPLKAPGNPKAPLKERDDAVPSRADSTGAAIELTHLATLYHDDVIDEADTRRGVPSANGKWGNIVAILVGDFLFARASSIAADVGGEVPRVLADAIARVVQGQVRELEHLYDCRRPVEHYYATVDDKTGALLEASSRLGAVLGGCPEDQAEPLRLFGAAFGMAFQIADDLLDLSATQEDLGKPPGTDLRDGVYTLPLLYAVETEPSLADQLGTPQPDVDLIRKTVVRTGAFQRALDVAAEHVGEALTHLEGAPEGPARDSLERLTRLIIDRVPVLE
ncbi:MAG TPA: polyprenyl synthetase family protein [Actinomycetota bacterium]